MGIWRSWMWCEQPAARPVVLVVLDDFCEALVDQLLIQVAPFEEGVLDASLVEGVEHVRDVAAVDVVFPGVDDDGAGDGELFADEAATGGAFGGVAGRGVDAGEADGLAADDFEA